MIDILAHDALASVVYSDEPVLLIFGQDENRLAVAREAAGRARFRVADEVAFEAGPERLSRQVDLDAALVVAEAPSAELDELLARLYVEAEARQLQCIVAAPASMIDFVTRRGFRSTIHVVIDGSAADLVLRLALAQQSATSRLHDVTRPSDGDILLELSEDTARISAILASLSFKDRPRRGLTAVGLEAGSEDPVSADFVRTVIRARRLREQYFHGELFADPAFDMLLDLYAARLEGHRVAVSSLCIAAAVPATTALRWIKALSDRGLFVRAADPQDGRRVYIELSDQAARAMGNYLAAVQRAGLCAL